MIRILLALWISLATTTFAQSHSKAEQTTPAGGAAVATVAVIEIRFDDPMRVTAIDLTGPDGALDLVRETGMDPVLEFRALPPEGMPAGDYTVNWRGLAADGHPMQGSFDFRVTD